jgi:hypothetical protein
LIAALLTTAVLAGRAIADRDGEGAERRAINAQTRQIYAMLDKPLYRPGETIWLRAWIIDASLRPASSGPVSAKLLDPKGSAIIDESLPASHGMTRAALDLPADLAGGAYTLELRTAGGLERRPVIVSTYELPRYKKAISFDKTSYHPGDRVEVSVAVARSTGEALRRARITGWIWLDGREIARVRGRTDAAGKATLRFRLPGRMDRGDGLLTVVVDHRGATESVQRRIPIAVNAVVVRSFPEGGDLVAGVKSRVYFDARDLLGNPLDLSGAVIDESGAEVGRFETDIRGMGIVEMVPEAGARYFFAAAAPGGETRRFAMRPVLARGCALAIPADAAAVASGEVAVEVTCTEDQPIALAAYVRGQAAASLSARASGGDTTTLRLPLGSRLQGVVRVMLSAGGRPVAERLIYRGLGRDLKIAVRANRERYQPRDKVTLTLETRGVGGEPVSADLALAVVDETVFETAGDKTGHILGKLYLEPELPGQRIDDPNFYFAGTAESMRGLDLLLGTRGWRRFR